MQGRTALVTGATGFVGNHLIRRLLEAGVTVHGVHRRSVPLFDRVTWWHADLAETNCARDLLAAIQPEIICHLASDSRGGQEPELVLPTFRNDLQSAVNMLLAVREFGCERLILLGSLEEPTLEMNIPASPYAAAKLAVTAYAQMFHAVYGVPVVMLRTFMSYGPGQKPFKLIPYVVNALLRGERPLVTSGQRMVDWVYIDDVIEGILRAMLCPDIEGARIDLGSGTLASVRSVVDRIDKIVDGPVSPKFGAIPERLFESERVADLGLARQLLDWQPRTDLNTGLKATIEFYRRGLEGGSPAGLAAE